MLLKETATCLSCGKRIEYTLCHGRRALPEDARCNALKGWLTVSRWRGMGHVDHLDFCCLNCLLMWAKAQVPQIPETFFDAFQEE